MPVIVLTKVDLCDEVDAKVLEIENIAIGVPIIETSVVDKDGLSQIYQYLKEWKLCPNTFPLQVMGCRRKGTYIICF